MRRSKWGRLFVGAAVYFLAVLVTLPLWAASPAFFVIPFLLWLGFLIWARRVWNEPP
jgi:hypothetical protein